MKIPYIQYSTLTSGTVTVSDTGDEIQVIHEAGATLTLTLAMPATPQDGQRVNFSSVGGITTLTMTASVGSIIGALTTLAAGGVLEYIFSLAQNKWYRSR